MIEVLPESSDICLGFKMSGLLTEDDYAVFLPKLNEAITNHGKINMLVIIDQFEGYAKLDVFNLDLDFGEHQYHHVEKAAYVGEKKWQKWLVKVMDPFTPHTDERFFDSEQLDEAWQWIKETS